MAPHDRPFFIVSAPRSGSTLLRLMLDAHPNLAVPPPDWLFDLVYPYLYSYGDLRKPANLLALAADMLATPTIKKWPAKPAPDESGRSYVRTDIRRSVCSAARSDTPASREKPRWGEKTPRNSFWVDEISALCPDAQFIHIVRDGRDQAIDISDSLLWPYSVYSGALLWQRYVVAVRDAARTAGRGSFSKYAMKIYVPSRKKSLRKFASSSASLDQRMLRPHETRSAQEWNTHPLHAKTAQPISTAILRNVSHATRPQGCGRAGSADRTDVAHVSVIRSRRAGRRWLPACCKNAGERHDHQSGERRLSAQA